MPSLRDVSVMEKVKVDRCGKPSFKSSPRLQGKGFGREVKYGTFSRLSSFLPMWPILSPIKQSSRKGGVEDGRGMEKGEGNVNKRRGVEKGMGRGKGEESFGALAPIYPYKFSVHILLSKINQIITKFAQLCNSLDS